LSAGASLQTPLGELTALPRPLAVFRGRTSKGRGGKKRGVGRGEEGRERRGREEEECRGGEGRGEEETGGREFVICPRKKKREVGAYI